MAFLKEASFKSREERKQLTKQFLQQRSAMVRMSLDETSYIAYRLGCSLEAAKQLIDEVKEESNG